MRPETPQPPPPAGEWLTHPLDEFYALAALPLPPLERVDGESLPQPYRRLLVHPNDMTPTLEEFYGEGLRLEVLRRRRRDDEYLREVVLRFESNGHPVEFGANRIRLDHFPPDARRTILEERVPLGHIMRDFGVRHTCQPNAFLRLASDRTINDALQLSGAHVLYGRHNRLFDPQGHLISEVVEILRPPARTAGLAA